KLRRLRQPQAAADDPRRGPCRELLRGPRRLRGSGGALFARLPDRDGVNLRAGRPPEGGVRLPPGAFWFFDFILSVSISIEARPSAQYNIPSDRMFCGGPGCAKFAVPFRERSRITEQGGVS